MKEKPIQFSSLTEGMEIAFNSPDNTLLIGTVKMVKADGCDVETAEGKVYELSASEDKIFEPDDTIREMGRYTALKTLKTVIAYLGYVIILGGCYTCYEYVQDDKGKLGLYALLISCVIALPLLAFSNLISVFVDIEYNTRKKK